MPKKTAPAKIILAGAAFFWAGPIRLLVIGYSSSTVTISNGFSVKVKLPFWVLRGCSRFSKRSQIKAFLKLKLPVKVAVVFWPKAS